MRKQIVNGIPIINAKLQVQLTKERISKALWHFIQVNGFDIEDLYKLNKNQLYQIVSATYIDYGDRQLSAVKMVPSELKKYTVSMFPEVKDDK